MLRALAHMLCVTRGATRVVWRFSARLLTFS